MRVHLINPSHLAFGVAVITPRWLYVLAAATPSEYGDPVIVDETLEQLNPETIKSGDVVGIGIHSGNALRGYEVGRLVRDRGAKLVDRLVIGVTTNPSKSPMFSLDERMAPQLALAESIEHDRATVWTIQLRKGVQFHDGKTLTADDVARCVMLAIEPVMTASFVPAMNSAG